MGRRAGRVTASSLGLLLVFAAACDKDDTEPGGVPELEERAFLAQSVTEDGQPREIVPYTRLELRFHEGAEIRGSGGCNDLGGFYVIEDGRLVVTYSAWTEQGCNADRQAQEFWYFEFLESEPALVLSGNALTLTGDGTEIEYLDEEVATPERLLVGRLWTVDTLWEGEVVSTADWSEPATFRFEEGGDVTVATGCNAGAGDYAFDGAAITFDDVGVTEEACADEMQQALEGAVLRVLHHDGPVTFEIHTDRLTLAIPGYGLWLTAD